MNLSPCSDIVDDSEDGSFCGGYDCDVGICIHSVIVQDGKFGYFEYSTFDLSHYAFSAVPYIPGKLWTFVDEMGSIGRPVVIAAWTCGIVHYVRALVLLEGSPQCTKEDLKTLPSGFWGALDFGKLPH